MPLSHRPLFLISLAATVITGALLGLAFYRPNIVSASYGEGGYYSYGQATYSVSGHIIGSGSFTTPNCQPPLSVSCTFSPTTVNIGQTVTWSASASGGTGSYQYAWSGTDGLSGSAQSVQKSYSTAGTKTGSVQVSSGSQNQSASCTGSGGATGVTVNAAPAIVSFISNPSSIAGGQSANLSWTSSNTTSCTLDQGIDSVPTSGSRTVSPTSTTTYTLNCIGPGGSDSDQITVTILPQCSDSIDNDGDTKIDYPADNGCSDASDNDESGPTFGAPGWKEVAPE